MFNVLVTMPRIQLAMVLTLVVGSVIQFFIIPMTEHLNLDPIHAYERKEKTSDGNVAVSKAPGRNATIKDSHPRRGNTTPATHTTQTAKPFKLLKACLVSNQPNLEMKKTLDLNATTMDQAEGKVFGGEILKNVLQLTARANAAIPQIIPKKDWFNTTGRKRLIEDNLSQLNIHVGNYIYTPGGHWKPKHCISKWKVAIIIPFRNRHFHLPILLSYLVPMLQKQQLEFSIFVINQENNITWNKGILMNIGFLESMNFSYWDCFVFHDVDHVPMSDYNYYGCTDMPKHFLTGSSQWGYRLLYRNLFGGVTGFLESDLRKFNGFPNVYWGWGGEDDEIYLRVKSANLKLAQKPRGKNSIFGLYSVISHHHQRAPVIPERYKLIKTYKERMDHDGLSNLKYPPPRIEVHALYVNVSVDIFKFNGSVAEYSQIAAEKNKKVATPVKGDVKTKTKPS